MEGQEPQRLGFKDDPATQAQIAALLVGRHPGNVGAGGYVALPANPSGYAAPPLDMLVTIDYAELAQRQSAHIEDRDRQIAHFKQLNTALRRRVRIHRREVAEQKASARNARTLLGRVRAEGCPQCVVALANGALAACHIPPAQ